MKDPSSPSESKFPPCRDDAQHSTIVSSNGLYDRQSSRAQTSNIVLEATTCPSRPHQENPLGQRSGFNEEYHSIGGKTWSSKDKAGRDREGFDGHSFASLIFYFETSLLRKRSTFKNFGAS
ncbi:hypothetical protein RRG08_042579 [Elysia crispata]|uniref:Uncharacterized protein n=1 Tax=Elysia crispata TaxID=231223 RepID=A0AAE0XR68_9GAST|nr:hypothetical protein RRG08_042579 [Elysia crispata]